MRKVTIDSQQRTQLFACCEFPVANEDRGSLIRLMMSMSQLTTDNSVNVVKLITSSATDPLKLI